MGNKRWRKRVLKAIKAFDDFLFFDHIYVGGGNAKHMPAASLKPQATVPFRTPRASLGGIRIWDMD